MKLNKKFIETKPAVSIHGRFSRLFVLTGSLFCLMGAKPSFAKDYNTTTPIKDPYFEYSFPKYEPNEIALAGTILNGYKMQNDDRLYFAACQQKLHGNTDSARILFEQFTQRNPKIAAAHYQLAICYMADQRTFKSINEAQSAYNLEKKNKWYGDLLANLKAYNGDYKEAAVLYDDLAKLSGQDASSYYMKEVEIYRQKGEYSTALKVLNKYKDVILQSEDDARVYMLEQKLYLQSNNVDKAIQSAKQLIKDNPYESDYLLNLGAIYQYNDKPAQAEAIYKQADSLFPNTKEIQSALLSFYLTKKDTNSITRYVQTKLPQKYIANDADNIVPVLIEAAANKGIDSATLNMLETVSDKLVAQNPQNVTALVFNADIQISKGKGENGVEDYKRAYAIDPQNEVLLSNIVDYYLTQNQMDSVLKYTTLGMTQFPQKAIFYFFAGVVYQSKQEYPKLISIISKGIKSDATSESALMAQMWSLLGDGYYFEKEYLKTDSAYTISIKLDSSNAGALNNYAYYLSEQGIRLDIAEKMSARSLKLRPGEASFLDTYGWIMYKQKKYEKAKDFIIQAMDASKEKDANLLEHMGDVEFKLGNKEDAMKYWQDAAAIGTPTAVLEQKIKNKTIDEP